MPRDGQPEAGPDAPAAGPVGGVEPLEDALAVGGQDAGPLIDLPIMAERAKDMLRNAVHTFIEQDVDAAYRVGDADDEVDRLYDQIYADLIQVMIGDPTTIEPSTHLLWVAHNLERIADRATNIAERTVYSATGMLPQMDVSSY